MSTKSVALDLAIFNTNPSQPKKNWQIVAIIIGSLVIIGAGGFGIAGLLHSHGITSLPQELAFSIGSINDTSLILISSSGLVLGLSLIASGIRGGKKPTSINLEGVPQSSDKLHQIAWGLKAPFYWCLRTFIPVIFPFKPDISLSSKVWEVVKRICKVIAVLIAFIPACLFLGLGAMCSRIFDTPGINKDGLHLAPIPLEPPRYDLTHDIGILKNWFIEERLGGEHLTSFFGMIDDIQSKNKRKINTHHLSPLFYKDITIYLQNIIELVKDPKKKSLRKDILLELARASSVCLPTWFETAKQQLRLLSGSNTTELQLLSWIQDIKEQIIMHLIQNTFGEKHWHALNYARYHVGQELGLNRQDLKHDAYFSQNENRAASKSFMIRLFTIYFHAKDVISAIQGQVNKEYLIDFYKMLETAITARGIEKPQDYVQNNFYDSHFQMNRNGVIMLLRIIGVLT